MSDDWNSSTFSSRFLHEINSVRVHTKNRAAQTSATGIRARHPASHKAGLLGNPRRRPSTTFEHRCISLRHDDFFFPHDDNQQLSLSYSSTASRVVTGGQLNPTPWTIDRDQHQQTTKQGIDLKPYHEAEDGSVSMRPQFNHSRQKSNIRSLCTNHRMATSQ